MTMQAPIPTERLSFTDLPPTYLAAMEPVIAEMTAGWFTDEQEASGYAQHNRLLQLYGRMSQCEQAVMPWLIANVAGLSEMTVLEVGCGSGSATAPLARAVRRVIGFDIDSMSIDVAQKRCAALGLTNVETHFRPKTWIREYAADWRSLVAEPVDAIYAYALIEHLTPAERILFLQGAWSHLRPGGLLITVELPNRLNAFDWHSSMLPFMDALPPELARLYYSRSTRAGLWNGLATESVDTACGDQEPLYRFGRGASYHEFTLALGDTFDVVAGPYSPQAAYRNNLPGYDAEWEAALKAKLRRLGIDEAFAAPSLDLILRKH